MTTPLIDPTDIDDSLAANSDVPLDCDDIFPSGAPSPVWPLPPVRHAAPPPPLDLSVPKFVLLDDVQLLNRPPVDWLVDQRLPARGALGLVAETGIGKTTLAVSLACCLATQTDWLGQPVHHPGPVIYVAGEGLDAVASHIEAWKRSHCKPLDVAIGVHTLPTALPLSDPEDVAELLALAAPLHPVLVIIDTLARSGAGLDENSAGDMGTLIRGIDRLRQALDCAVLVLHHSNRAGTGARGSGAFIGALDTCLTLVQDDDAVLVECTKQRNASPFTPVHIILDPVFGSTVARLKPHSDFDDPNREPSPIQQRVLAGLVPFGSVGATRKEWQTAVPDIKIRSFYHAVGVLVERHLVSTRGPRFIALS